jgi:hypothetical protein
MAELPVARYAQPTDCGTSPLSPPMELRRREHHHHLLAVVFK